MAGVLARDEVRCSQQPGDVSGDLLPRMSANSRNFRKQSDRCHQDGQEFAPIPVDEEVGEGLQGAMHAESQEHVGGRIVRMKAVRRDGSLRKIPYQNPARPSSTVEQVVYAVVS